jgi:hypothetical protein
LITTTTPKASNLQKPHQPKAANYSLRRIQKNTIKIPPQADPKLWLILGPFPYNQVQYNNNNNTYMWTVPKNSQKKKPKEKEMGSRIEQPNGRDFHNSKQPKLTTLGNGNGT